MENYGVYTNKELNDLAVRAKTDEVAAWEIKAHYMPFIEMKAEKNWYKMNNEASFIDKCYSGIDYAIRTFDPQLGDFNKRVHALIKQALREHCGRRGNKREVLVSIEELHADTMEGTSYAPLELIADESVNVERDALADIAAEEMINELAGDDERKRFVLEKLAYNEEATQSEVARLAAEANGTKFNTERVFITRYLTSLRKEGVA